MTDRPIIFSASMVRALLDGRKTQTRRILKDAPLQDGWHCDPSPNGPQWVADGGAPSMPVMLPWRVGDRLWVREACGRRVASFLGIEATNGAEEAFYVADGDNVVNERQFNICPWWKGKGACSPIHMPRWASRFTLTVTEVRVQRLNEISEADARAEGEPTNHLGQGYDPPPPEVDSWQGYGRASFCLTWCTIHGSASWDADPWVAAVTFTVERRNIDAAEATWPTPT